MDYERHGILIVTANDNPGIGAESHAFLHGHNANILQESGNVVNLEYAVVSLYFGTSADEMKNIYRLAPMELEGLSPIVIEAGPPCQDWFEPFLYDMDVVAYDAPGIAGEIEECVAEIGVNIRRVEGRRLAIGEASQRIYRGSFKLQVPPMKTEAMRQLANQFTTTNHWDVDLRPEHRRCEVTPVLIGDVPASVVQSQTHVSRFDRWDKNSN